MKYSENGNALYKASILIWRATITKWIRHGMVNSEYKSPPKSAKSAELQGRKGVIDLLLWPPVSAQMLGSAALQAIELKMLTEHCSTIIGRSMRVTSSTGPRTPPFSPVAGKLERRDAKPFAVCLSSDAFLLSGLNGARLVAFSSLYSSIGKVAGRKHKGKLLASESANSVNCEGGLLTHCAGQKRLSQWELILHNKATTS